MVLRRDQRRGFSKEPRPFSLGTWKLSNSPTFGRKKSRLPEVSLQANNRNDRRTVTDGPAKKQQRIDYYYCIPYSCTCFKTLQRYTWHLESSKTSSAIALHHSDSHPLQEIVHPHGLRGTSFRLERIIVGLDQDVLQFCLGVGDDGTQVDRTLQVSKRYKIYN